MNPFAKRQHDLTSIFSLNPASLHNSVTYEKNISYSEKEIAKTWKTIVLLLLLILQGDRKPSTTSFFKIWIINTQNWTCEINPSKYIYGHKNRTQKWEFEMFIAKRPTYLHLPSRVL